MVIRLPILVARTRTKSFVTASMIDVARIPRSSLGLTCAALSRFFQNVLSQVIADDSPELRFILIGPEQTHLLTLFFEREHFRELHALRGRRRRRSRFLREV